MSKKERERERKGGREREKHFCGTVLFLGIKNFLLGKWIFWMRDWKFFGSENETEDPKTQRPRDPEAQNPETQRLRDKHFCGTVLCLGIKNFLIPKWNIFDQKIKNDPKREFV